MQPPEGATHTVAKPDDKPRAKLRSLPIGSTGADEGDGDGCVGDAEGDEPIESDAVGVGVCDRDGCRQLMSVTAPAAPVNVVESPTNVTVLYVAMAELT